ncbi:metalloprotease [Halobacteriales archaeon SW_10_66_29]|nr:MAG: metalloprotease [Halobacteriales archaeon SW_10_66_29]
MVGLLTWVLVGITLYTVIAVGLQTRGYLPEYAKVSGPLLTIHTQRGRQFLDWLAQPKRFWRAWGNVGVGITVIVMVLSGFIVVTSVFAIVAQPEGAAIQNPQNVLVIPGVNDFLPLSAAPEIIFGLLVGLVVHEGGHGLLCRVENIDIDSMGVALFALIPIGAFVEPDADNQREADRGAQTRMFAAGITNNFAITAIALLLLVGPIAASVAVVPGAPVGDTLPGSGAEAAGLGHGDVITAIDGQPVENESHLEDVVDEVDDATVEVSLRDGDPVTVERRLLVFGAVPGVADDVVGQDPLTRITAVDGTAVNTEAAFDAAVADDSTATLETDRGNVTIPVGAFVAQVNENGPLADAGAPTDGTAVVITKVGDQRVTNASTLRPALDRHEPGDTVTVETYVRGHQSVLDVRLGEDDDGRPILGVGVQDGYSGLILDDFGVDTYPANQFLGMLTGQAIPDDAGVATGVLFYLVQLLVLPFAALVGPDLNYNFAGFTADVTGFFVVEGPLAFMGGALLLGANLLFWTAWINFNLALFNCIPAFPLDGGHIMRTSVESVASRLSLPYGRQVVTAITLSITVAMIGALLVMIFGPMLLA